MNQNSWQRLFQIPESLQSQLDHYRTRVWSIKLLEAAGIAALAVAAGFLTVFALDRLWDTPATIRAAAALAAVAGVLAIPYFAHRWMWRYRQPEQLARLLSHKLPRIGDQMLGVIELAHNPYEQARSPALCQAAIEQVAQDAKKYNFAEATPPSRYRTFLSVATVFVGIAGTLAVLWPAATRNAWARFAAPWSDTPRYTFAAFEPMAAEIVVPHGEPFTVTAKLSEGSLWQPSEGRAQIAPQAPLVAPLSKGAYEFQLPPQIGSGELDLRIGDYRNEIQVDPKVRPELTAVSAEVKLPEYLGRPEPLEKDVRGGAISLVKGSTVSFNATANRELASARAGDAPSKPSGENFTTDSLLVDTTREMELRWTDKYGLECKQPFVLSISALDDEQPQVSCEDLPRNRVVLDTQQLVFRVHARDDFGVREVGISWKGLPSTMVKEPAEGERPLAAGGNDKETLELKGTFTASSYGIEPQPIELRLYVSDYYPDRPPVYSAPYLIYVLNAEQHAIWITEQLAKWHRQSLEVRDRELRLYETNKELRSLSSDQLDTPENRRRVETQAAAERVNGRRLSNLTLEGQELLRQASRNPEIGVGHLDRWAEMLQILDDIAANRMPSVANLLKDASQAPVAGSKSSPQTVAAGQNRGKPNPGASQNPDEADPQKPAPPVPQVVDMESSQQPPSDEPQTASKSGKPSTPTLRLPTTTVMGQGKGSDKEPPAEDTVDQAVTEQRDLLAEFEKVANEINNILGNMEGSTLVKRLKAASREQSRIADGISDKIDQAFGTVVRKKTEEVDRRTGQMIPKMITQAPLPVEIAPAYEELSEQENESIYDVSLIMDDMHAYFERRRLVRFKTVLDDMRNQDVLGGMRQLSDDILVEQGISISQAEYWSDSFDRWAEDLIDPACSGACPGCRSKGSLPPSIVLEVLQILEGEVNLREETRVAEQAKPALDNREYLDEGNRLSDVQDELDERVIAVVERIKELPDAEAEFAREIKLLGAVSMVMKDASNILARPDTGSPALAAETEAIELLLQSKRINPKGGGGGGANPGGGGTGDTNDSALALIGSGLNEKEVREDKGTVQATGETGSTLPEEFRAGLDQYFSRLESEPASR